MTPEELFDTYREKAERIAQSLCWHFRVSGALDHQEEARNEALIELWRRCQKFDPKKQALEHKKEAANNFWLAISGSGVPTGPSRDPYANFWMWATTRVRGRVMDYFRSEKLITRIQAKDKGTKRTLLHHERFISASSPLPGNAADRDGETTICLLDMFASKDRADANDGLLDIQSIMKLAALTEIERQVLEMFYSDKKKKDIAACLDKTQAWVTQTLEEALYRMRLAAGQEATPPLKMVDTNLVSNQ